MRYASKIDRNQSELVAALRYLGFDVDIVSREKGMYDILVSGVPAWASRAVGLRVEIKRDAKASLTDDEFEYWAKQHCPDNLIKATCVGDVLRWFGR